MKQLKHLRVLFIEGEIDKRIRAELDRGRKESEGEALNLLIDQLLHPSPLVMNGGS